MSASDATAPSLRTILAQWGRIGCIGFGGPPAHVALLRELCVDRRRWIEAEDFEHGVAATSLLPGPGSTQMAIYCAWRLRGGAGALVGGAGFILPGLVLIIALSALFLGAPPPAIRGIGAGAGAAVIAVALEAGVALLRPGFARTTGSARGRWAAYVVAGAASAALLGPWLVVALLACGVVELLWRRPRGTELLSVGPAFPLLAAAAIASGGLAALCWTAFKVGALSYGGGFVIIPLMQGDAVGHHHWLTQTQFLNAVALGQATPGPVVHTVAAIGYAAHGVGGALLAAAVAFAPSFSFIALGGARFDRLRDDPAAQGFLGGAGPAAIGAILGSTIPLASGIHHPWQAAAAVAAGVVLFVARRGVVAAIAVGAGAGLLAVALGAAV